MVKKLFLSLKLPIIATLIPWVLFVLVSKHSLVVAGVCSIVLMALLNFRQLAKGFILPWGTVILFAIIALNAHLGVVHFTGLYVIRLINSSLLGIVLFSMIINRPFTLQYAREEVAPQNWKDPHFIKINWILTWIWAFLMFVMTLPGYFLRYEAIQNFWFWKYGLTISCLLLGMICNKVVPKLLRKKPSL